MNNTDLIKEILKYVKRRLDASECQRMELEIGIMIKLLDTMRSYDAEDAIATIIKEETANA